MTDNMPGNGEFAKALLLQQVEELLKQSRSTQQFVQTTAADIAVIKSRLATLPCDKHSDILQIVTSNTFATKADLQKVDDKVRKTVNWRAFLAHTFGTVITVGGLGLAALQLLN